MLLECINRKPRRARRGFLLDLKFLQNSLAELKKRGKKRFARELNSYLNFLREYLRLWMLNFARHLLDNSLRHFMCLRPPMQWQSDSFLLDF